MRGFIELARRVEMRELLRNPRHEIGRILGWVSRRLGRAAEVATHGAPAMPVWLQEEMIELAHIEPELLSAYGDTRQYSHYGVPNVPGPGQLYRQLVEAVGQGPCSHVMVLPWLVPGGADRGALHHLRAWTELGPRDQILVITTEPAASPWRDRIPDGVRLVEFGLIAGSISFEAQVQLLTRLLVQLQPQVVHNINSRLLWQAIRVCGLALRQKSRLYASLFCDDYIHNMVPVGHARNFLRDCHPHLVTVFCDNSIYPKIWANDLGLPLSLFTLMPFPYDGPAIAARQSTRTPGQPRVLWAGRFDYQKRPDVLLAVARAMPDWAFDVHGRVVLGAENTTLEELSSLPNVTMHGEFKQFSDIVRPAHVAYLHTAAWEGMPTILMDAAAAGLPIVASPVGGIVDFVDPEGLVAAVDDVQGYVQRLRDLGSDSRASALRVASQDAQMAADRSWSRFLARVDAVEGYAAPENSRFETSFEAST